MNALRELLLRRMTELGSGGEPESLRKMATRGEPWVSLSTLSRIYSGKHFGRLNEKTVKGLALAMKLDVDQVRAVAEQAVSEARAHDPWLPERAMGASPMVRRQAIEYIDWLMEQEERVKQELRKAEEHPTPPQQRAGTRRRKRVERD